VVCPISCASQSEESITFETEVKSLKQMRQICNPITAPFQMVIRLPGGNQHDEIPMPFFQSDLVQSQNSQAKFSF
jgi:hypothetical protein